MAINVNSYLGNTNLKGVNVQITYTPEQLREYMKCAEDPMYFVEKYVRIINVDTGLTPLKLRPFQKKIVKGMIDNRFVICKIPRQSGKCVTEETEIYVKNKKRNEPELIQIGQFYERISNSKSPECIIRDPAKFEKEYEIDDWEVLTPGGWKHFCGIGKTKKFRVHVLETSTRTLRCADKHIVFREGDDPNFFEEVFIENLKPGDKLLGQKSIHTVRQIAAIDEYEHMYDLLDVNGGNCYYTNEILSHNSTTVVSFLLHYILFNKNVSVALLANKLETAQELMDRLKLSYENLPKWLQQGIVEWNKRSIVLENGSKVKAGATSATAIRGQSFNCIAGDSVITVKIDNKIQKITIENLHKLLKINNDDAAISDKQIYTMVFRNNNQIPATNFNSNLRNTSHYSKMYEWKQRIVQFSKTSNSCSYFGSSTSSENGVLSDITKQTFIRSFSDGFWKTRIDSKLNGISKKSNFERISRVAKKEKTRKKTFPRNETKNFKIAYGHNSFGRIQEKNINCKHRSSTGNNSFRRILQKNIRFTERSQENFRLGEQNKQKSRQNQKNRRKTSWNETISGIQIKNEYCCENEGSTYWTTGKKIEVETSTGFKKFLGIKQTKHQYCITVTIDGQSITCTPDHKIMVGGSWVEAKTLPHVENGYHDVYDLLEVEDVHSFIANGINVHNCIVLDEFAHISSGVADEFFSSAFPTITSGKSTKLIIVSTPNGMNMFYRLWEDAVNKKNDFVPIEAHWSEVPNRDEKFKTDTIAVFGERRWAQEFDCAFLGSDNTLISPSKLSCLSWCDPIYQDVKLGLDIYEEPIKNKTYVLCVDTSRGEGLDYHAATITDVTCLPYRVVAKLRNNYMSYQLLPDLLNQLGKQYNEAHILVELNDLGQSVADSLHMDHEYENLIFVVQDSKGQKATFSSSGKTLPGVKTSKTTKSRGCSTLKDLIEMDKLLVTDFDIITEFSTYVSQGAGYEATEGNYDDTVSTLVSFAWLTTQPYFQEVTSTDIKKKIFAEKARIMTESLLPFGMYNDGIVQTDPDEEDIFAERKYESLVVDDYFRPINIPKTERADVRDTSNWKQEFNFD